MVSESTAKVASLCIYLLLIFLGGFLLLTGVGNVGAPGAVVLTVTCGALLAYSAYRARQL